MSAAMRQESRATVSGDVVAVRWPDGTTSELPCLWLRDNCGCNECRVEQTGEKRFMIGDVPVDLQPADLGLDGERLWIGWPDGHRSEYALADIRALQDRCSPEWREWHDDYRPRRTDFAEFLRDDGVAESAIGDFLAHGAAILANAPYRPGTLETLVPRLGPIREVLFGRIHDVTVDCGGYNVAHTAMALPPHNDFASYSWPPSVQALHMLVNDCAGGESFVVDGWRILRRLRDDRPAMFDALCSMPVPFREFGDDLETRAVAPIVSLDVDGRIAGLRFSNQLMQAIDPERPDIAGFYRAYHELCRRITDDAAKVRFRLQGGEILIVAAHRVLHGREAFEPTDARHLQDAYFEHDNVRNHLIVLQRRGECRG